MSLPEPVARDLRRRVALVQRDGRIPAVSAALSREGGLVLATSAGDAAAPDVQFRIGSITKTFTAALVLQLRDDGRLRLDDRLEEHLPGTPFGRAPVRDLLAHLAGLTREPRGPFWEASPGGPAEQLVAGVSDEDLVLPGQRYWHYSNLAFGLLGMLIERHRGGPFAAVLQTRVLDPLGLSRTSWLPRPPYLPGWRVHPFADVLVPEPTEDTRAMGPAGQLWSTPSDLCTWGDFLADPDPGVLAADSVAEMCTPVALTDARSWTAAYGLGVQLFRRGDRVLVGHGGSMPGYVAGLALAREERVVAAATGNAWQGADMSGLAADMVTAVLDADPPVRPWTPGDVPAGMADVLGDWWYRGIRLSASWRYGHLVLRWAADVAGVRAERFEPAGDDTFRGVDVGQRGELLRVVRDAQGRPAVLDLDTWLLTREHDDPRGGP